MAAGAWGSWSHCVSSQEAERRQKEGAGDKILGLAPPVTTLCSETPPPEGSTTSQKSVVSWWPSVPTGVGGRSGGKFHI